MKKAFSVLMIAGLFLLFGCNDIVELENNTVAESTEAAVAGDDLDSADIVPQVTSWLRFAKPTLNGKARTALPEFNDDMLENCAFVLKAGVTGAANARDVKLVTAELLSWDTATMTETALSAYTETALTPVSHKVTYSLEDLAAGNYRVQIHLYADTEKQHPINTWRELAIITGGQTSLASRTVSNLNKVYTITLNANGGEAATGTTLPTVYTRNSGKITLPTLTKSGYSFGGWYSDTGFTNKVTEIAAGSTGNKTFYAQWNRAAITVTIENPTDLILAGEVSGTSVTFAVTGGTGSYAWRVDNATQDGETGDTFVFDASALATGSYEVEVLSGDLSSMATVFVGGADSYLYVSATGSDDNSGTRTSPLATIAAATAKMSDSEIDYTIFVDGIDTDLGAWSNGKSTPVLLVATSVPVTLTNIKLSGGFLKSGEALVVGGGYYDENDESVEVTANVTIKDGVLITDNNKGDDPASYGYTSCGKSCNSGVKTYNGRRKHHGQCCRPRTCSGRLRYDI